MPDIIRVARLVVYEGDRKWVEDTVSRSIQGTKRMEHNHQSITALTLRDFPEVLSWDIINQMLEDAERLRVKLSETQEKLRAALDDASRLRYPDTTGQ